MDDQKAVFSRGEGDGYWRRNAETLGKQHAAALAEPATDPILRALLPLRPERILEVGAANGWRLDVARRLWQSQGVGIDPSSEAVADGLTRFPEIALHVGTADKLPDGPFDCVVFGFCLYLCDRADLFRIATEADRVLAPRGCIVVYDFFPPAPYRNAYAHQAGVFSHKMDYSRLWSWNPAYVVWQHEVTSHPGKSPDDADERLAVTVLKKL